MLILRRGQTMKWYCSPGYEQEQCTVATIEIDQSDERGTFGPGRRRDRAAERERERQGNSSRSASCAGHVDLVLGSGRFTVRSFGLVCLSETNY